MRKIVVYGFAVAFVTIISGTIIEASLTKSATVAATSFIDPTILTLAAGELPIVQVTEPF